MAVTTRGSRSTGRPPIPKRDTTNVQFHPDPTETRILSVPKEEGGIAAGSHPEMEKREPGIKMPDIGGALQKGIKWLTTYDPWKKK